MVYQTVLTYSTGETAGFYTVGFPKLINGQCTFKTLEGKKYSIPQETICNVQTAGIKLTPAKKGCV